jgi:hypothetical protein
MPKINAAASYNLLVRPQRRVNVDSGLDYRVGGGRGHGRDERDMAAKEWAVENFRIVICRSDASVQAEATPRVALPLALHL